MQQPAVRFGTALEPAAVAAVAAPELAGALRAAYGAALGLPPEAVLIAGVFDVRTGALTTFLSTDDVNVAGNREDAEAVLDALLGGGGGGGGGGGAAAAPRRGRRRAARALQAAAPNALNVAGLAPKRNASSAAVAVFFNALAPCTLPCGDAQSAAAAAALRGRVLATEKNETLLAAALPPGVAWALNAAAVIPFSLPRIKIRWRLWAWLAALPSWVVAVSAAAGALVLVAALALWYRRARRAAKRKVVPDEVAAAAAAAGLAAEELGRQQPRRVAASGGAAPGDGARGWRPVPTPGPPRFSDIPTGGVRARLEPDRLPTYASSRSRHPSFSAPRAWEEEEGGLPARGAADAPQQGWEGGEWEWEEEGGARGAPPPWRRAIDDAWEAAAPLRGEAWGEEFPQQAAAAAAAGRGLAAPALRRPPAPRGALSPQRAAAAAVLRAPLPPPRAQALRSPAHERAALLAARAKAAAAAAAAAALAAAEAEAEEADANEEEEEEKEESWEGAEIEEDEGGEEEEDEEEGAEEEEREAAGGPSRAPAAPPRRARPGPAPQRGPGAASMDNALRMAQLDALRARAREGRRQAEQRQQLRGGAAGAAAAQAGPAARSRSSGGGDFF